MFKMKKWMFGLLCALVGAGLTISTSAAAHSFSIFGKKIDGEFPVTVNGKQLEIAAGTIEGTSYLPVRVIGEALNLEVGFDPQTGITLDSKEETSVEPSTTPTPAPTTVSEEITLQRAQGEISRLSIIVNTYSGLIEMYKDKPEYEEYKSDYDKYKAELKLWQERLAELEAAESK
jgi:hypothetical protein